MTYGRSNRHNGSAVRQTDRHTEGGQLQKWRCSLGASVRLWWRYLCSYGGATGGQAEGLPVRTIPTKARTPQDAPLSCVGQHESSLLPFIPPSLRQIWGQGYYGVRGVAEVRDVRGLGADERVSGRLADRSAKQRQGLFAGQLPFRHGKGKYGKPLLLAAAIGLAGCSGGPPIVTTSAAACSALLPHDWRLGVAGADLPSGDTVGDWVAFGDAQTGKLDVANGRTKDAIEIVERCEARDDAAIKRATRGFWARLFG